MGTPYYVSPEVVKGQGLTLVHFSAQCKRFLWDRRCIQGLFRGCLRVVRAYEGVCRVYLMSETAQVELKSGQVSAPAKGSPYDWSSDVWSLGCLLYELATLRSPFEMEGANLYAVFRRISKAAYAPLPVARFSRPLQDLVRRMLCVEPEGRPDINEVLQAGACTRSDFSSA